MATVFVLMRCEEGSEDKILKNLEKIDTTREITPTIGHYDLVAKITYSNTYYFDKIIDEIHRDKAVRSTKVLRTNE